jgi:class 3 adenylate cyclase
MPTARIVMIRGAGHIALGKPAIAIAGEIERFVKEVWEAEVWEAGGWKEGEPDRVLTTVLFTDESVRELGLEVRAGLHTGECEVMDGKVGGIAVHIGARVAKQARPGEVLVSSTVKDLGLGTPLPRTRLSGAERHCREVAAVRRRARRVGARVLMPPKSPPLASPAAGEPDR